MEWLPLTRESRNPDTSVLLDVLGGDSQFGERVVADFLVGSHASLCADALLTRDRGFYRTEFSGLRVLEP